MARQKQTKFKISRLSASEGKRRTKHRQQRINGKVGRTSTRTADLITRIGGAQ